MEKKAVTGSSSELDFFCDRYFERVDMVHALKNSGKYQILDVYHEAFIEDPSKGLIAIMEFLGLNYTEDYIEKCSEIVFENPHLSRLEAEWTDELKARVQSTINSFDFLSGYSFE